MKRHTGKRQEEQRKLTVRVEQIVPYNSTKEDVDALYESVNGFIFPGGGSKITDAARHLYAKVVNASQDE